MDLNDIFEIGNDFEVDQGENNEFFDEFELDESTSCEYIKPEYINVNDYTLNSPLIADEVDEYIKFLINPQIGKSKHLRSNTWDLRSKWLEKVHVDKSNIKGSTNFHKFMTNQFKREDVNNRDIMNLVNKTNQDSSETFEILESFAKGWMKRQLSYRSRKNINVNTLKYGAFMLDLHFITLILNSVAKSEQSELKKTFNLSVTFREKEIRCFMYESEIFGTVHIGMHFVYFPCYDQLCDRNMLLLMKDTSIARFQTLLSMQFNHKLSYSKEDLESMIKLYYLGDCVVEEDAIQGYKAIGFIEAVTTHKLSELARKYRPKIPQFKRFPQHIEETKEELEYIRSTVQFFDHISTIKDKNLLLTVYGSFRHWGHPFIQYLEGLEKLYGNVTKEKTIDIEYAELLASNFAYKVLHHMFTKKKKWFVDKDLLDPDHPLEDHINNNTWPTPEERLKYGPKWHELPLTKCWEIPDVIDQSQIYSDKSHSIDLDELIEHIRTKPGVTIPTKKVLISMLNRPATNWPEFLAKIENEGLDWKDLIIGLKPKERENKPYGRFFTLMSWKMREYFVITEYLIKSNIIPLFKGLTMADDQNTVLRKMMDCTSGQGGFDYNHITIANHIDFEKWNNHQTKEATTPVFKVMGQFHGYPKLFSQTHEFFEKSLVYYKDRPDLLVYNEETNRIENKTEIRVCWNGQKGGFEGIRQKGWTVLGYLVIEQESDIRNTNIKVLAQGDNQVICTQYATRPSASDTELEENIKDIVKNNDIIMERIREGSRRLGLIINEDETLQSADMLIYGKNIIFRGNLTVLREKRFSRVSCVNNDQLPNYANIMSTLSTNCLTVSHFSKNPIDSMIQFNWLGNMIRNIVEIHNPALRMAPSNIVKNKALLNTKEYKTAALYLDPSIGGIGGTSFARFLIRMFPDPVTESLSFWKKVHDNTESIWLKEFSIKVGNPTLARVSVKSFNKLLENPGSLNLPRGISAVHMIKDEIKKSLMLSPGEIKNEIISECLMYAKNNELTFLNYLKSIKPLFPRFLSEFKASTFLGITESVIGLFENSKTIRTTMSRRFRGRVDESIFNSEVKSIQVMLSYTRPLKRHEKMWDCSSKLADDLRKRSWGEELVGTTIPHPLELINTFHICQKKCEICNNDDITARKIVVIIPEGLKDCEEITGKYQCYMGSNTKESTSVFQPWEKQTIIPIIARAQELTEAINWFISPNSKLAQALDGNITSLTGEESNTSSLVIACTGSGLHRYFCVRVSNGGFLSSSPTYYTRTIVSSDDLAQLGSTNYDFMHQSLMLYAQMTACNHLGENGNSGTYHFHFSCKGCIREIEDPTLDTDILYQFPDVSSILDKWKPAGSEWFDKKQQIKIQEGKWDQLNISQMSYQVGVTQGYIFSEIKNASYSLDMLNDLFPITIQSKVLVRSFLRGIIMGISLSSINIMMERQGFYVKKHHKSMWKGIITWMIDIISNDTNFVNLTRHSKFTEEFITIPHHIPPSYPTTQRDQGSMVKNYLMRQFTDSFDINAYKREFGGDVYVFGDFDDAEYIAPFVISINMANKLKQNKLNDDDIMELKSWKSISMRFRNNECEQTELDELIKRGNVKFCPHEIRHSIKSKSLFEYITKEVTNEKLIFGPEYNNDCKVYHVDKDTIYKNINHVDVPSIQDPMISGLRKAQLATGSFLKANEIIKQLNIKGVDMMSLGDGSGGISAALLRHNLVGKLIFNSKIDAQNSSLKGTLPSPPAAISQLDVIYKSRCINLNNSWEACTDLSKWETWEYFMDLIKTYCLHIGLIFMDMEIRDDRTMGLIENNLLRFVKVAGLKIVDIIFKTYCDRVLNKQSIIDKSLNHFSNISILLPQISSSFTSEVYVRLKDISYLDNRKLFLNKESLRNWLIENAYCFKADDEEFERALKISKFNTLKGIPSSYISDPLLDLEGLLMNLGIHSGISCDLINKIRTSKPKQPRTHFMLTTLIMGGESFINTFKKYTLRPSPPSDQRQLIWGSYYVGCLLYLSILSKNIRLYKKMKNILEDGYKIHFVRYYHKEWFLNWSHNNIYQNQKKTRLNSCMSMIGFVIRTWHKIINPSEDSIFNMSNFLKQGFYNASLYHYQKMEFINKHTGILEDILETYD